MLNIVQHKVLANENSLFGKKHVSPAKTTTVSANTAYIKPALEHLQANFLTFKGADDKKIDKAIGDFAPELKNLWKKAAEEAEAYGSKEIDTLHVLKCIVDEAIVACNSLDMGLSGLLEELTFSISDPAMQEALNGELVKLSKAIETEIKQLSKGNGRKDLSSNLKSMLVGGHSIAIGDTPPKKPVHFDEHYLLMGLHKKEDDPAMQALSGFFEGVEKIADSMGVEYLSDEDIAREPVKNEVQSFLESLTNIPMESLPISGIYNDKANTIATATLAGRNVIVGYDNGAMPTLLELDFTRMLKNANFKQFDPDQVIVKHLNANQLLAKGSVLSPTETLRSLGKDGKRTIVFVEGFGKLLVSLSTPGMMSDDVKPDILFNSTLIPENVQIVGLMNNATRQALASGSEKDIELSGLLRTLDENFENIRLGSPSPSRVKEVLKTDDVIFDEVINRFDQDVIFEDEAIDASVDYAMNCRTGSMPGKAIDLMKFVIAAKANATDGNFESISKTDVDNFVNNYPDLKQTAKSAMGGFSVTHDTGVTLKDVGGVQQAKEVVEELLDMIKNPQKYERFGDLMTKGILLTGSPGNGKTHLAKAIAGEAGVPFVSVTGSDFNAKYMGVGTERVKELFAFARDQAKAVAEPGKKGTAIIFIDEFDSVGKARSSDGSAVASDSNQTLNTLLTEMDGLNKNSDVNIVVLAATNKPDLLDEALVDRPGRFDHTIEVPNPTNDKDARKEILQVHVDKRNIKIHGGKDKVLTEVANRTSGCSGARLADIVKKACMIVAKDNRQMLTLNDFVEAKLESTAGRMKKVKLPAWYKEATVAHECGHALVSQVMFDMASQNKEWHKPMAVDVIVNEPRGNSAGAVHYMPGENPELTFESTFAELASSYAGYAVEKAHYGINGSMGITSDLKQAKQRATAAVTQMGMGPSTGVNIPLDGKPTQENQDDIKLFVNQSLKASEAIVDFYDDFIKEYVATYKAKTGKGGKNLSILGSDFKTQLDKWVMDNNKQNDLKALYANLQKMMKETQEGYKPKVIKPFGQYN